MTTPPPTLTLTTDELLAVLQVMGTTTMNGLGDPLAGLNEREQAARLNAGAETLLNRGLCRIEGDQLIMDDMLVAFVGASLLPDATLLLSVVQPDQSSDPHYFNATDYIQVEHQSPRPGIHLFSHIPDAATLMNRIETLVAPVAVDQRRAAQPERWTLPDAALNGALLALRAGRGAEARITLAPHGLAEPALTELIADLGTATTWVGMVGWGLRQAQPAGGSSAILYVGGRRFWLFTPVSGNPNLLSVSSPAGGGCAVALMQLADPFRQLAA